MPFDLAAFKKLLGEHEKTDELVELAVNAIDEEKEIGIEKKRKADREAKGLRVYKKALESAGFDPDQQDVDEFISELSEKADKAGDPDKGNVEVTKLQKTIEKLQQQFSEKEQEAKELRDKGRRSRVKEELSKAIGDKVYGSQYVINDLLNSGRVGLNESDEVVFIDGDDEVAFDKGVKGFLDSNADIVKNSQRPGGGSSGGGPSKAKYSSADLDGMSVDDIIANKDDVLGSLKAESTK